MLVLVLVVDLEHAARLSSGVPEIGSGLGIVPVDRPRPGGEREQLSPLSLVDQGENESSREVAVIALSAGRCSARRRPAACPLTRARRIWLEVQLGT